LRIEALEEAVSVSEGDTMTSLEKNPGSVTAWLAITAVLFILLMAAVAQAQTLLPALISPYIPQCGSRGRKAFRRAALSIREGDGHDALRTKFSNCCTGDHRRSCRPACVGTRGTGYTRLALVMANFP